LNGSLLYVDHQTLSLRVAFIMEGFSCPRNIPLSPQPSCCLRQMGDLRHKPRSASAFHSIIQSTGNHPGVVGGFPLLCLCSHVDIVTCPAPTVLMIIFLLLQANWVPSLWPQGSSKCNPTNTVCPCSRFVTMLQHEYFSTTSSL
jgi:hypothetical protein